MNHTLGTGEAENGTEIQVQSHLNLKISQFTSNAALSLLY